MGFDSVAWIYDRLARMVFGNSLHEASVHFLPESVFENTRILVAGGGTGLILNDLEKCGKRLIVDYIDASREMINQAKKRGKCENLEIKFYCEDIGRWKSQTSYDLIITPFFLDCFEQEEMNQTVSSLSSLMNPGARWLFSDFVVTERVWQRALIRGMYMFFGVTAGLKTSQIPDYDFGFQKAGLSSIARSEFFHGMVQSRVYVR